MATTSQHFLGRQIGNWELLRLLGEGSFGAVYEARNRVIADRRAAIKVLHTELAVRPDIRRRFLNEASAASRADHENIIQVFDAGMTEDGLSYVVMELLRGQTLAQLLRSGPLGPARAIAIGVQIASALQAAHGLGIIHRDLKPDNIFIISRTGRPEFVKVLDFGIAKLWDQDSQTKTGMWLGTPAYMSPEQWRTLPDIDGRSDLYSLGVILFECISGHLPFSGKTPYEWLSAHLGHPVPSLADLAAVPPELARCVGLLLSKDRADRPRTAAEVAEALQRCLVTAGRPGALTVVTPTVPVTPAPAAVHASTLRSGTGQVAGPRERPASGRALAAVLALATVAGGALWLAAGRRPPEAGGASRAPIAAAPLDPAPSPAPVLGSETARTAAAAGEAHAARTASAAEESAPAPATSQPKSSEAATPPVVDPAPQPAPQPAQQPTQATPQSIESWPAGQRRPQRPGGAPPSRRAAPLVQKIAGISITSQPGGATVKMDGASGPMLGVTPIQSIALPRGLHTLSFWLNGYEVGVLDEEIQGPRTIHIELRPTPRTPGSAGLRDPFGRTR